MNDSRYPETGSISLKMLCSGEELDCAKYISSVTTVTEFNRISSAELVFNDGGLFDSSFRAVTSRMVAPGAEIEIQAGYERQVKTLFKGVVVSQKVVLDANGTNLYVQLRHPAYKMTLQRSLRSFEDSSDSDVIESLCSDYGIRADVSGGSAVHEKLVQYNCSDWDFLNLRAETAGLFPFTSLEGISAKPADLSSECVLELDNSFSIRRIQIEIDGRDSVDSYEGQSWDCSSQDSVSESSGGGASDSAQGDLDSPVLAKAVGSDRYMLNYMSGQVNPDELKLKVDSDTARRDLSRIAGKLSVPGSASLWPGSTVRLKNLGDRFNGEALVSSVIHEISPGDWTTTLGIGVANEHFSERYPDIDTLPADGTVAAAHGLQIAKVEALEGDPAGEERIRIRLLGRNDASLWARLSTLDAGDGRGCVFNPEIDDEVVVGFINGHPGQAVVLGSLFSSPAPSPHPKSDDNDIKGFVSREGIKLTFDDKNKALVLETSGGNAISISDKDKGLCLKDQNGNSIVMDDQGISIESKKDLKIKAVGDVNIEGTNVTVKANAQFKGQGSASAEISSSGSTAVKGSIVQIN